MVRAKFICSNIHHVQMSDPKETCAQLSMMPVYDSASAPENKTWAKWTPGGLIQLTVTNPDAVEKFELGKAYYVDFTPA